MKRLVGWFLGSIVLASVTRGAALYVGSGEQAATTIAAIVVSAVALPVLLALFFCGRDYRWRNYAACLVALALVLLAPLVLTVVGLSLLVSVYLVEEDKLDWALLAPYVCAHTVGLYLAVAL